MNYREKKLVTDSPDQIAILSAAKRMSKLSRRFYILAILFGIVSLGYMGVPIWQFGKPPGAFSKINLIVQFVFMVVFTINWVIMYHVNRRKEIIFAILQKIQENF